MHEHKKKCRGTAAFLFIYATRYNGKVDTIFIYLAAVAFFVFGTIIGSFLNVVIARYQTGLGLGGRSQCFSCGNILAWYELFPIISFLFQKGRCKTCKSAISWQYPIIELLTGVIFLALFFKFFIVGQAFMGAAYTDIALFFSVLFIACLFIIISVYDFKHAIIPNNFIYAVDAVAFAGLFVGARMNTAAFITGVAFFLFFALLWLLSGGRAMGFGDAKFALGIGWLLGPAQGISALLVAFWSGAVIGVLLVGASHIHTLFLARKSFTLKSEIPFGPFLAFGACVSFLFNLDVGVFISLLSFHV
ncbi:MAG: prepilin peptidase [Candidatus Lloydbacteria bacterium]|nr:prepilin peptidase [Candidatus Lloydbacteria bacterium]